MNRVEFAVLGPVTVFRNGQIVDLPGVLARKLLALLLARWGDPIDVDVIAEQLWHGSPPRTAKKSVQVHVHHLRRLIGGEDSIVLSRSGYAVPLADAECDAVRFRQLIHDASVALGKGELAIADELFTRTAQLWRGDPFADVNDIEMVTQERDRLSEQRLIAVEDHVEVGLALGRAADLIPKLHGLAAEHPFRERLHGQLMLALYRSQRQAEALQAFKRARGRLVAELGVEPGDELRELHHRMLRGDPSLRLSGAARLPDASSRNFLPHNVPDFTGRRSEREWLWRLADSRAATAATAVISALAGLGGIGKTALMLSWAHEAAPKFPDGQLYVDLRGSDPQRRMSQRQALHHLLTCLGVPAQQLPVHLDDAVAHYRALTAGKRLLILIDDAGAADDVRPLLPAAAGCFVVAASRHSLAGLIARDGARRLTLTPLDDADALALLRHVVGSDRTAAEPDATSLLMRICGGLPLALRIAAAHLAEHPQATIADYVATLQDAGPITVLSVEGDERFAVKTVLDTSLLALKPSARRMFTLLSLVPGRDFGVEIAATVAAVSLQEARQALATLTAAHLVERKNSDRYHLHDLVRAYGLARLHATGESEMAPIDRMLKLYRDMTWTAIAVVRPDFVTPPAAAPEVFAVARPQTRAEVLDWLTTEHANVAAALVLAASHGMSEHIQAIVDPLWQLCHFHGRIGDWIGTFTEVVTAIREASDTTAVPYVLNTLGNAYVMAGKYSEAIAAHTECVDTWTAAGQPVDAARAQVNLAGSLERLGELEQARVELEASLDVLPTKGQRAYVLFSLASVNHRLGRLPEAFDQAREAVELLRPGGMTADLARCLNKLAEIQLYLKRPHEAMHHAEEAIDVAQECGNRHLVTMAKTTMASILRDLGRYQASLELSLQAHDELAEMGVRPGECENLIEIGLTRAAMGQGQPALHCFEQALTLATELGERHLLVRAHTGIAKCLQPLDRNAAREHLSRALAISQSHGLPEAGEVRLLLEDC